MGMYKKVTKSLIFFLFLQCCYYYEQFNELSAQVAMNGGASNEAAGEVTLIADELSRAVELTLNPTVSHDNRSQAYNACER